MAYLISIRSVGKINHILGAVDQLRVNALVFENLCKVIVIDVWERKWKFVRHDFVE